MLKVKKLWILNDFLALFSNRCLKYDIQGVLGETLKNGRILLFGSKQERKNGRVCPEMYLLRRYSGKSGFFHVYLKWLMICKGVHIFDFSGVEPINNPKE